MSENANHQPNAIKGTILLSEATHHAEVLLNHAAEHGTEVPENVVRIITAAKKSEQDRSWQTDTETQFWLAYRHLAQLVAPVTIDSLKAYQIREHKDNSLWRKIFGKSRKQSRANQSVYNYAATGLITVLVMLIIQIYAIKGTTLLNTIDLNTQKTAKIENRMSELILITENPDNRSALMEKNKLELENEQLAKEIESSTMLLDSWLQASNFFRTTYPDTIKAEVMVQAQNSFGPPSFQAGFDKNIMIIQEAQNLIFVLNLYVLPILYGLLGAFIYVIRVLMKEYQQMIFTTSSNINHSLRIFTGALGGLIVGIFWGDIETLQIGLIASLQPLAVAFMVGYSVEFLFQLFDSVILKISSKNKDPKTEQQT